jgi:hypothetical protein
LGDNTTEMKHRIIQTRKAIDALNCIWWHKNITAVGHSYSVKRRLNYVINNLYMALQALLQLDSYSVKRRLNYVINNLYMALQALLQLDTIRV